MLIKLHCNLPFNWKYFVEWRQRVETHNAGDKKVDNDRDLYDAPEYAEMPRLVMDEVPSLRVTASELCSDLQPARRSSMLVATR